MTDPITTQLQKIQAQYEHAAQQVKEERTALYEVEDHLAALEEARAVVQVVSVAVQQKVHDRVAGVVTHCLRSVFGDGAYEFRLVFEQKRGKTECRPVFVRYGQEVHPLRGAGGGAADVASFALRLVSLVLTRPALRRVLILDEPFRFLSAEYTDAARSLIEELSEQMGVQFIVVTHSEVLQAGTTTNLTA